jgi:hypothetical protein
VSAENVQPTEAADQPELPEDPAKRAAFVAGLREFATWLEERPWAPLWRQSGYVSNAQLQIDLYDDDGMAQVSDLAARLGVKVRERDDRTAVDVCVGSVTYVAIAWHRTEVVEPSTDTGLSFSREPESTVVTPVPAGVDGHPEGRAANPRPITQACVLVGDPGFCTVHEVSHQPISKAECGCPVYAFAAARGDNADTIVDHRPSSCTDPNGGE